jgi:hypothetical protein
MPAVILVLAVFVALAFYLELGASDQDIDLDRMNHIKPPAKHLTQ